LCHRPVRPRRPPAAQLTASVRRRPVTSPPSGLPSRHRPAAQDVGFLPPLERPHIVYTRLPQYNDSPDHEHPGLPLVHHWPSSVQERTHLWDGGLLQCRHEPTSGNAGLLPSPPLITLALLSTGNTRPRTHRLSSDDEEQARAPEPGGAADPAGASRNLGATFPAKRGRLFVASPAACLVYAPRRQKRAFHVSQAAARTLPAARCAHASFPLDARQRRS
jgi:hypothetical protein